MSRRFLFHVLLACALLLAQYAGLAHAASHLGNEPAKQEQNLLHLKLCDKCVSFEKLSFGPATIGVLPLADAAHGVPPRAEAERIDVKFTAPYRSRAPPVLL